jgi:hypothetical protein
LPLQCVPEDDGFPVHTKNLTRWNPMPTKFCPHCGKRTGFEVKFNVVCQIGDEEEWGFLRICQECEGRFITLQEDERINKK